MRKTSLCSLLVACWASCAAAADGGVMSARILAATGGGDTSGATRTTARDADKNSTTNLSRTTRARPDTADVNTKKSDAAQNVVRSGNRVVNVSTTPTATRTSTVISRSARTRNATNAKSAAEKLDAAVSNVGQSARTSAASINAKPAIRRAGLTLRPSVADVGGRAKIAGTDTYTGSNIDSEIRNVTTRAAAVVPTAESIAEAKDRLEKTAELNKSCQTQYNECMDQFCAVIDANQKRCSCSSNLKDYAEVEAAVKDANNQLNDVAQRIRYIGLSADEIRAILSETEAETALSTTEDNTETRSMLADIEELIIDPTASVSYTGNNSGFGGLDINLDFSADSGDMFNLDFLTGGSNDSFSSLRGAQLYSAAKKRCATVLDHCTDAGATTAQITGNYDLAIDKDCIAYENGLKKMNDTLKSNVRSANNMLQKARLSVLQNKNQYDAKGCISALETCMTDEMVCGAGYLKCVDPTKRYIDENGEVVLGQNIGSILDFMKTYNNANISRGWLESAYDMNAITPEICRADSTAENNNMGNNGSCVASYLMKKIGTKQKVTDEGLCRAVLDKCQAYTYNDDKYDAYNDVIVHYVQRAMVNIKAAQSQIISDYASSCISDIANCYNTQSSQVNAWSNSTSVGSVYNVMRGACRNVALTCAFAVFHDPSVTQDPDGDGSSDANGLCPLNYAKKYASGYDEDKCIESISEMFYQSLLCPDNSIYVVPEEGNTRTITNDEATNRWVNTHCQCNDGYVPFNGACVANCNKKDTNGYLNDAYHTDAYTCACTDGTTYNKTDKTCGGTSGQSDD